MNRVIVVEFSEYDFREDDIPIYTKLYIFSDVSNMGKDNNITEIKKFIEDNHGVDLKHMKERSIQTAQSIYEGVASDMYELKIYYKNLGLL